MNSENGCDVEDLRPGMQATFSKTITEADVVLFAGVSGDNNAVHVNEEFAATTRFGSRIAHGFLTASVMSAAVANRLPGPGTIYLSQQMSFLAPVRPGDTVHATVTVVSVDPVKARVVLKHGVPGARSGGHRRRGDSDDHLERASREGKDLCGVVGSSVKERR